MAVGAAALFRGAAHAHRRGAEGRVFAAEPTADKQVRRCTGRISIRPSRTATLTRFPGSSPSSRRICTGITTCPLVPIVAVLTIHITSRMAGPPVYGSWASSTTIRELMLLAVIMLLEAFRRWYRVLAKGEYSVGGKPVLAGDKNFAPPEYGCG